MNTRLKQIADHYLLRGLFCQEIGLWNGKTGMAIFFFLLSRQTHNRWYEEFAGELLDNVCNNLSQHCPITFADGLCGIGWAIEFLKKEGFIEGDTDEILEEVDKQVMERDVRRITDTSLETGLAGIVAYVRSRLESERTTNNIPFETNFLEALNDASKKQGIDKCFSYYNIYTIWNEVQTYYSMLQKDWKKGILLMNGKNMCFSLQENLSKQVQYEYECELIDFSKKTLLIFSEESEGASYGVGTYISHLIQCFDLSKWNVCVIELFKSSTDVIFNLDNRVAYYGIPHFNDILYSKAVFYYLATRLKDKTEIYCHFNFFGKNKIASLFKQSFNASILFTLHYMNWRFELNGNEKRMKEIINTPTNKEEEYIKNSFEKEKEFMMEYCDCIIAVSRHSYKTLHNLYNLPLSKLALIPNAISISPCIRSFKELRYKYGFEEKEKIIIFVGRIEKNKGIFDLISTFKQVLKIIPEVRLVIAGNGDFSECMKIAYPYNRFITFFGFVTQEQLKELYNIADLGVVPSYFEEFGYVAAEMMLNKCPIIIRNTTGLKDIAHRGKYGISFESDEDGNSLKNAIIQILMDGVCSYSLKKAQKRTFKEFSLEHFKKNVKNIYTNLKS